MDEYSRAITYITNDPSSKKASELRGNKQDYFKSTRASTVVVTIEKDFIYLGQGTDTSLLLEEDSHIEIIHAMAKSKDYKLHINDVKKLLDHYMLVYDYTIPRFFKRLGGMLFRNFGGEWFVRKDDYFYLLDPKVNFELYFFKKYTMSMTELKEKKQKTKIKFNFDFLTDTQTDMLDKLLTEKKSNEYIATRMNRSTAWVAEYRDRIYKEPFNL